MEEQSSNSNSVGNLFRIKEIHGIREELKAEIIKRQRLYDKYKQTCNTLQTISISTASLAGLTSAGTIASLVTIVGAPLCVVLAGLTTGLGVIAASTGMFNKMIVKKLEMHEKLMTLAINKKDAVNKKLSLAYLDGQVSDKEYKEILEEYESYILFHSTIRHSTRSGISTNKSKLIGDFIDQSKPEVKQFLNKLDP